MKLVAITEKGRKALAGAIPLWQTAQERITEGLGTGRWAVIRREIQQIAALAGEND